ncbi:TIGR02391 family protein [Pseudomonas graminis]|uniref:TIGR02391 family protein n=1 Tax=Pseudomonas graminis TaxID=158627 RepID=UPI00234B8D4F|nr:TIGR02391 family protein [Pseudomonas graminis]MDC6379921.1 TIGR02391 family protein [Pseudomonas graminis]
MGTKIDISKLAGIEYHGTPGFTQRCVEALMNVVSTSGPIESAWLLSWFDKSIGVHSILLNISASHQVLIKPGFASGYPGEGPSGLSTVIEILEFFKVDIEEYAIGRDLHERCEAGCLLSSDLDKLSNSRPLRPARYHDYVIRRPEHGAFTRMKHLLNNFPVCLDLGLIDERLADLAVNFFANPDWALATAFRRLESTVRDRTDIHDKSGRQLFVRAFEGENSLLHWNDSDGGEQAGKAQLFVAVFLAYRNPRAHREIETTEREAVLEFMLINQLYVLEKAAVSRVPSRSFS